MRVNLNNEETRAYQNFVARIANMRPGVHYIREFFAPEPSVPRIARQFYEDVRAGKYANVSLAGMRSAEGYIVK